VKDRIADFVHGADGLGNTFPALSDRKPIDTFAPDYLIQKVNEFPGEITIVALGPLTNLAKVRVYVFQYVPLSESTSTSLLKNPPF
jgi:inosine-uridine nucleoside N-ribohydrolase